MQTGVVTLVDPGLPAAFGLPERLTWSDKFYVTANPFTVRVEPVLAVKGTSYDPTRIWPGRVGHQIGSDHPEAWRHHYERGRVFVTLPGHDAAAYRDERHRRHLLGGIYWTVTGLGQRR